MRTEGATAIQDQKSKSTELQFLSALFLVLWGRETGKVLYFWTGVLKKYDSMYVVCYQVVTDK